MSLIVQERRFPNGVFGWVPSGEGLFPAIVILHQPDIFHAGWSNRDALLFAAHGFAALPAYDNPASAVAAARAAAFCDGRLGVFSVGAGADLLPAVLCETKPDALAMHGPSPVESEPFSAFAGPWFLSHGTNDERFPIATSRRLEALARCNGLEPDVHYYEGQDHGLNDEAVANRNTARYVDFFKRTLCARP